MLWKKSKIKVMHSPFNQSKILSAFYLDSVEHWMVGAPKGRLTASRLPRPPRQTGWGKLRPPLGQLQPPSPLAIPSICLSVTLENTIETLSEKTFESFHEGWPYSLSINSGCAQPWRQPSSRPVWTKAWKMSYIGDNAHAHDNEYQQIFTAPYFNGWYRSLIGKQPQT